ncbi:MAG: DUF1788 domain-containing protein [Dehalococcoidales bacterium]|nr:DUF1788 domain-containing protein [Dehalococcoidales bacterium]
MDALIEAYARFVQHPWDRNAAGPERVWLAVYPPLDERRLRYKIDEFKVATQGAGKRWKLVDLTTSFEEWLGAHEYREAYFESPGDLEPALEGFGEQLVARARADLTTDDVDGETVVALLGAGSLFGFFRVSRLIESVNDSIRGRLLVFFPGERHGSNYRLLDAQDGWNYLAVPIVASEE